MSDTLVDSSMRMESFPLFSLMVLQIVERISCAILSIIASCRESRVQAVALHHNLNYHMHSHKQCLEVD